MSRMRTGIRAKAVACVLAVGVLGAACAPPWTPDGPEIDDWVYQLQGYPGGRLDALAAAPQSLAVIDLARDGSDDYFSAEEVRALRESGKSVLAYFEIGAIEDYRPEYPGLPRNLLLNSWPGWPGEYFVRYWEPAWWDLVVRPRVDRALDAGFDGVYLDAPGAYEEIDLSLVPGETRASLGRKMVDLIVRISDYAKQRDADFGVFPQNAPELRTYSGYVSAIDGLGVEELFFLAHDAPCSQSWCQENLANVRALRDAGKLILAVDYATQPANVATACSRYAAEGFVGYVTTVDLDTTKPPCD